MATSARPAAAAIAPALPVPLAMLSGSASFRAAALRFRSLQAIDPQSRNFLLCVQLCCKAGTSPHRAPSTHLHEAWPGKQLGVSS